MICVRVFYVCLWSMEFTTMSSNNGAIRKLGLLGTLEHS